MSENAENQYLTFGIDGDTYGVSVMKVREVLEYTRPTKLPKMVDFLKGLINIRGVGVPVVDLRSRFGLPEREPTQDTAVLIIEIDTPRGQLMIGAIADEVFEVIDLNADLLEPPPQFGNKIDAGFLVGIGKREGSFILLLDMDRAFREDEIAEFAAS